MAPLSQTDLRADDLGKSLLKAPGRKRKLNPKKRERERINIKKEKKEKKKNPQKHNLPGPVVNLRSLIIPATVTHLKWPLAG